MRSRIIGGVGLLRGYCESAEGERNDRSEGRKKYFPLLEVEEEEEEEEEEEVTFEFVQRR